ncbi:MAG: DUF3553 domain-containing protein [Planctomycetota bacterium]
MADRNGPASREHFDRGHRVVHPSRPEWGVGAVKHAAPTTVDGKPGQRLRIDFPNKGTVTLNTSVVALRRVPPDGGTPPPASGNSFPGNASVSSPPSKSWLQELEAANGSVTDRNLWDLPQDLTDPFTTLEQRLEATLKTFRFSTEPGPLFEWAVIQTGLDDPLTRHTRVELEQAFPRFARDRDHHLRDLVRQLKRRNDHPYLQQTLGRVRHPVARAALQRAIRD